MYKKIKIAYIFFILLLCIPIATASLEILWRKEIYSNIGSTGSINHIQQVDGGFEVFANVPEAASIIVSYDGDVKSVRNLKEPFKDGLLYDFLQTTDNNFLFLSADSHYPDEGSILELSKIDELGKTKFKKTFDYTVNDVYPWYLIETQDNGFLVAGQLDNWSQGDYWGFVLKTDQNGEIQWEKRYGKSEYLSIDVIFETNEGNIIVTGEYSDEDDYYKWIRKLDQDGNEVWVNQDEFLNEIDVLLIEQFDDEPIVLVKTVRDSDDPYSAIAKLNSDGSLEVIKKFNSNLITTIKKVDDKSYVLAGGSYIFKTDLEGNIEWNKTIGNGSYPQNLIEVVDDSNFFFDKYYYFVFGKEEVYKDETRKRVQSRNFWVAKASETRFKPLFYILIGGLLILIAVAVIYFIRNKGR